MRTVKEMSALTGISVRTLHYYDQIGLLKPSRKSEAGYRLYDDKALETLRQLLFFREFDIPLREIKAILEDPALDRDRILRMQRNMLLAERERVDRLIGSIDDILKGEDNMDFSAFDPIKWDEYAKEAKERWGGSAEYREFEERQKGRSTEDDRAAVREFMAIFTEFGALREEHASAEAVRAQVKKLQGYITEHFYACSDKVLAGLGRMYAENGEMAENIDRAAGEGAAAFISEAIGAYCGG